MGDPQGLYVTSAVVITGLVVWVIWVLVRAEKRDGTSGGLTSEASHPAHPQVAAAPEPAAEHRDAEHRDAGERDNSTTTG
ncbi:MAG TPA: hypothetical protein VEK07_22475 [Polyangiaceae bacterium]|nr:hypothetical protein [Polyangiaceae bacterium]